jgi:hypothetical protein
MGGYRAHEGHFSESLHDSENLRESTKCDDQPFDRVVPAPGVALSPPPLVARHGRTLGVAPPAACASAAPYRRGLRARAQVRREGAGLRSRGHGVAALDPRPAVAVSPVLMPYSQAVRRQVTVTIAAAARITKRRVRILFSISSLICISAIQNCFGTCRNATQG